MGGWGERKSQQIKHKNSWLIWNLFLSRSRMMYSKAQFDICTQVLFFFLPLTSHTGQLAYYADSNGTRCKKGQKAKQRITLNHFQINLLAARLALSNTQEDTGFPYARTHAHTHKQKYKCNVKVSAEMGCVFSNIRFNRNWLKLLHRNVFQKDKCPADFLCLLHRNENPH